MSEELYHFGVRGMKWGHHRAPASSSSGLPSRSELRTKNQLAKGQAKVAKAKAKVATQKQIADNEKARDADILSARANLGKTKGKLQVAKQQYKIDKVTNGKVQAKQTLRKVKDQHYSTLNRAMRETGKERVDRIERENREAMDKLITDIFYQPRQPRDFSYRPQNTYKAPPSSRPAPPRDAGYMKATPSGNN